MMNREEFAWASHVPLLKVAMDIFNFDFVLEVGIGNHSTPILKDIDTYIGIENNLDWRKEVQENLNLNILHHSLPKIKPSTFHTQLHESEKNEITKYYKSLKFKEDVQSSLLFVDCYASTRVLAINALQDKFDVIIFHDAQPKSNWVYSYHLINKEDWEMYYLTSPMAWTAIMVRKGTFTKMKKQIKPYIQDFKNKYPKCTEMELIK